MSRYHNKDIKILVALLPTLKNVFVFCDKIGSHRNSSPEFLFEKGFVKNFEKIARKYLGWSLFLLNKTKREKRKL